MTKNRLFDHTNPIAIRFSQVILFICLGIFCVPVFSQQTDRTVIGNAGDYFSTSKGSLEWTVGEIAIEYYNTSNGSLSQGFHQTETKATGIAISELNSIKLSVFPNPVQHRLYMEYQGEPAIFEVELTDVSGKKCFAGTWNTTDGNYDIGVDKYANGLYVLTITDNKAQHFSKYKIVKSIFR